MRANAATGVMWPQAKGPSATGSWGRREEASQGPRGAARWCSIPAVWPELWGDPFVLFEATLLW